MYQATPDTEEGAPLTSSKPKSTSTRRTILLGLATVATISTGAFIGFKSAHSADVESSQAQGMVSAQTKRGKDGKDGNDECPSVRAICKAYEVDVGGEEKAEVDPSAQYGCGGYSPAIQAFAECSVECCEDQGTICRGDDPFSAAACQIGCLFTPDDEVKVAVTGQEVEAAYEYDEKVDCKQECHDWCACPGRIYSGDYEVYNGRAILFYSDSGDGKDDNIDWVRSRMAVTDQYCYGPTVSKYDDAQAAYLTPFVEFSWRADKRGPDDNPDETCEVEAAFDGGLEADYHNFRTCTKACKPVCEAWDRMYRYGYD